MINKTLTLLSNIFSNLNVSDMETCYKVFRTDILKSIPIRSDRFGFEPEITMKSGKRKLRIYEVPISYHGRTYEEGKKISWRDGLKALGVILHFWIIDDLYNEEYGRHTLNNLTGTPQYLAWIASVMRPHVGDTILELGAGVGDLTGRLMGRKSLYVAAEQDPIYLHFLSNRFLRTPNVQVLPIDLEDAETFRSIPGQVETALCVNLLEQAQDPAQMLRTVHDALAPGGNLLILVAQSQSLFGTVDRNHGFRRRFDEADLSALLRQCGFSVQRARQFNRVSRPAWWLFSRMFQKPRVNKLTLKLFDMSVWFWRRIDWMLPWKGLSLIVVATREN